MAVLEVGKGVIRVGGVVSVVRGKGARERVVMMVRRRCRRI
jgi:hypothetical protein